MNLKDKLDFLQIQEVTTKRQKANGTREFKLPINDPYGDAIHVASYSTGYVRRTRTSGRSDWQLNKTKKEKRYVEMTDYDTGRPVIRTFNDTVRVLIEDEQERLEYLIAFCLKNYYIGYANMLSSGEFIPRWKHEAYKDEYKNRVNEVNDMVPKWKYDEAIKLGKEYAKEPDVKVIVNGHRYNLSGIYSPKPKLRIFKKREDQDKKLLKNIEKYEQKEKAKQQEPKVLGQKPVKRKANS